MAIVSKLMVAARYQDLPSLTGENKWGSDAKSASIDLNITRTHVKGEFLLRAIPVLNSSVQCSKRDSRFVA